MVRLRYMQVDQVKVMEDGKTAIVGFTKIGIGASTLVPVEKTLC